MKKAPFNTSFFVLGIVFMGLGVSFMASTPAMIAFLPIGVVFFVLAFANKPKES